MMNGTNLTLRLKRHGVENTILDAVDFSIPAGRVTAFIGSSGAGKTSLLRCCASLTTGYDGEITLNGKNIQTLSTRERVHNIGFVFQLFNLFPHKTVLQNCMAPLLYEGHSFDESKQKAEEALEKVMMHSYADRYPSELSGGQKQRVAIARALVLQPKILFFDEPTSALDPQSTQILIDLVKNLSAEGITIVLASHDMVFVSETRDRIYFMENGRIAEFIDNNNIHEEDAPRISAFLSAR